MGAYRLSLHKSFENSTADFLATVPGRLNVFQVNQTTGENIFAFNVTSDVFASVTVPENHPDVLLGEHFDIESGAIISMRRSANGDILLNTNQDTAPMVTVQTPYQQFTVRMKVV